MRIYLILSESPIDKNSGGTTAAYDRLQALLKIASNLSVAFIDWDKKYPSPFSINQIDYYPIHTKYETEYISKNIFIKTTIFIKKFKSIEPWFSTDLYPSKSTKELDERIRSFNPDVICFDNITSTFIWMKFPDYPRIYFAHNVERDVIQYTCGGGFIKRSLEKFIMKLYENRILSTATASIFYTERDRSKLCNNTKRLTYVVPPAFSEPLKQTSTELSKINYIIMPTNAKWPPNKKSLDHFFSKCLPLLSRSYNIYITGADSNGYLANIAKKNDNVKYLGLLNRGEYEQTFINAKLFVNPTLYGSGFQIKLIEAIRFNIPIVSTSFSNPFSNAIPSSDDYEIMAKIINDHMSNAQPIVPMNYDDLYRSTTAQLYQIFSDIKSKT